MKKHLPRKAAKFCFIAKFIATPGNGLDPQTIFMTAYMQDHGYQWMHHHRHICDLLDINRSTLRKWFVWMTEAGLLQVIPHWTGFNRHLVARCPKTMLTWMAEREAAGKPINTVFRDHLLKTVAELGDDVDVFRKQSDPLPWVDENSGRGGLFIEQLNREDADVIARAKKHHFVVPAGILHSFQLTHWNKYILLMMLSAKCYTWTSHEVTAARLGICLKTWKNTMRSLREVGLVSGHNYDSDKAARGDKFEQSCYRKGAYALSLSREGAVTNWQLRLAAGLPVLDHPDTMWLWDHLLARELGETKKAFLRATKNARKLSALDEDANTASGKESPHSETLINEQEKKPLSFPGERNSDSSVPEGQAPHLGYRGTAMLNFSQRTRQMATYLEKRLPGSKLRLAERVVCAAPEAPPQQPLVTEAIRVVFPGVAYWMKLTPQRVKMVKRLVDGKNLTAAQWRENSVMQREFEELYTVTNGQRSDRRQWETPHVARRWASPPPLRRYFDNPAVREFFAGDTLGGAFVRCFDRPLSDWDDAVLGRIYRKMMRGVINADIVARLCWVQSSEHRMALPPPQRVATLTKLEMLLWAKQIAMAELQSMRMLGAVYAESVRVGNGDKMLELVL